MNNNDKDVQYNPLISNSESDYINTLNLSDEDIDDYDNKSVASNNCFLWILTIFAAIGGFLFGYDTGVISGAILFIQEDFELNSIETGAIVSGATGGALIGALVGGWLNDHIGRKRSIIVAAIVFAAGAIVLAIAPNFTILLIGRLIVGFGVGLASMSVPIYVAEMAPPESRGSLVSMNVAFITGGQFISYLVDLALADVHNGWRWMLGLSAVPAVLQLIGMFFLPESPRYLVRMNRMKEAHEVLKNIRNKSSKFIEHELNDIIETNEQDQQRKSMKDLLQLQYRRPLIIAVGLQTYQQLCGINTAMYYSPMILKMAGFSSNQQAILFACLIACTNMIMSIVAMFVVDRYGRRSVLLFSVVGLTLGLVALATTFYSINGFSTHHTECAYYNNCKSCILDQHCGFCPTLGASGTCVYGNSTTPLASLIYNQSLVAENCLNNYKYDSGCINGIQLNGILAVLSLILYVALFAVGMGPIPWVAMSEIFPLNIRGAANGVATSANWTTNLIVSMAFLPIAEGISPAGTFYLFSGIAVTAFIFVHQFLPETKGKSLEEIQNMFKR